MLFICPVCQGKLNTVGRAAVCSGGHSFDFGKEGYINLLLSGGGTHGDNAEMVKARRAFLGGGYYSPLCEALSEEVLRYAVRGAKILDAGCGEGYYAEHISRALSVRELSMELIGLDISRDAARRAAKRGAFSECAVASSYKMPIETGSLELVYNVFSPFATDEVRRVLRESGIFIAVIAAEEHLFSLKAKIYDTPYKNKPEDTALPGFSLLSKREIRFPIHLGTSGEVSALFGMTPYAYRTSALGRSRLAELCELDTEGHFYILTYRKTEAK